MAANSSLSPPSDSGSPAMLWMSIAFIVVKSFLVLPPSLLVLYLGLRRRRSLAACSHADVFSYHSAAVELIYALGAAVNFWGLLLSQSVAMLVGLLLCVAACLTVSCFNILTCVERYLAVVHPVVYLRFRRSGGVRIRNVSIGCVWLLCFLWVAVSISYATFSPFVSYFCFLGLSLVVVSFCSLSVLCVLVRPGPGDRSRDGPRGDQSKRRAFRTITAVLAVLLLCFSGYLVTMAVANSLMAAGADMAVVMMSGYWWSLPSTLVLPVLFLQRAGKQSKAPLHCLTHEL